MDQASSEPVTAAGNPGRQPLWIGVTTRQGSEDWVTRNTHNYLNRVREYGAEPIVLAPDQPVRCPDGTTFTPDAGGRLPDAVLTCLDGLILSGGGDVHPQRFGQGMDGAEAHTIDEKRDEMEIRLAHAALALDLPVFGICRGCQVLNVAAGGALIQHFDGHRTPQDGPTRYHDVQMEPGSQLRAIVAQATLPVNTFHHQGVDRAGLAPIFRPAALASPEDWLVEAYESTQHRWVIGVQWHPERSFELDHGHRRIWDDFVSACRTHQERRFSASAPHTAPH